MANNELDFATLAALVQSLGGSADPAVITEAVEGWLDDHPEATTTVEDGSITKAKLDSNLAGAIDDVSELKTAIDDLSTATSLDVGKALSPKTVTNGKVTEWQYKVIGGGGGGAVEDVQINGTSVVTDGVANVPTGTADRLGVVKVGTTYGTQASGGQIRIYKAESSNIKLGSGDYKPIVPSTQHEAAFYGLAKAAGADLKDVSDVTVGTYPDTTKAAIQNMLGVANKANIDGSYPDMTVGNAEQLVATVGVEDAVPYNFRTAGGSADIGDREVDKIVGGTVAWNQLVDPDNYRTNEINGITVTKSNNRLILNGTASSNAYIQILTSPDNKIPTLSAHKYLVIIPNNEAITYYDDTSVRQYQNKNAPFIFAGNGELISPFARVFSGTTVTNAECYMQIHDLTQMFGSTIADYIYSLETATAGAGVAWFRKLFPKPYYAYNAGELMSVQTSAHKMVGFNLFNKSNYNKIENAWFNASTPITDGSGRTLVYIPCFPNTKYCASRDAIQTNERFLIGYTNEEPAKGVVVHGVVDAPASQTVGNHMVITTTTGANARYLVIWLGWADETAEASTLCINLSWDGERDGEYEPYQVWEYPLDSDLVLRGIPKLDVDNNLYYDGDTYESDGTVTRRFNTVTFDGSDDEDWRVYGGARFFNNQGVADFTSPDTSETANIFTNRGLTVFYKNGVPSDNTGARYISGADKGSHSFIINLAVDTLNEVKAWLAANPLTVVYPVDTPTTETADPYQNPQIVEDFGTEEYVDSRAVAIPVGHETTYRANLRAKLEMSPNSPDGDGDYIVRQANGQNEYVLLTKELPAAPTSDGNYILKCTVASGAATYTWEAQT